MNTENRDGNPGPASGSGEDWNDGMEEMDDFTVRGGTPPAGMDELPEDITGVANTERPLDPI